MVLAEKVIKVTSDSSPDKEATTGKERIKNSRGKGLLSLQNDTESLKARAIPAVTGFLTLKLCPCQ